MKVIVNSNQEVQPSRQLPFAFQAKYVLVLQIDAALISLVDFLFYGSTSLSFILQAK